MRKSLFLLVSALAAVGCGSGQAKTTSVGTSTDTDASATAQPSDSGVIISTLGGDGGRASADAATRSDTDAAIGGGSTGLAPCTVPLPSGFCAVSEPGDFIGQGRTVKIDGVQGQIQLSRDRSIHVHAEYTGQGRWDMDFSPATAAYWNIGRYMPTERYPFMTFGAAGLDVSSSGMGCNMSSGSFDVTELEFQRDGTVARFAATFVQHCEGGTAALRGAIAYNARGKPDPVWVHPEQCTVPGRSGFCLVGSVGSSANGLHLQVGASDGMFTTTTDADTLSARWNASGYWNFDFDAPDAAMLGVGTYDHATGFPSNSSTEPGINVSGGSGCGMQFGLFRVLELTRDGSGNVTTAAIDFEQHCGSADGPPLHGKLRIDSNKP